MTPNMITLVRVFLAFSSVALFRAGSYASLAALLMMLIALSLDAVDGIVARRTGRTSDAGAAFDIAADRIIESIYWIYFASAGLISFWIPVIVVARGGFTDFLRAIAFRHGQNAFGDKSMIQTWWGKLVVGSRASRAAYGLVKCAAFLALGIWLTLDNAHQWQMMLADGLMSVLKFGALTLAISTVVFCVARGVPVIAEGIRFFRGDLEKQW
jgi:phosphatidylglycerophosphate synthase